MKDNKLSDFAFTLSYIQNNIFRLRKRDDGKIVYLLNEGPIPTQYGLTTEVVKEKTVEEIFGEEQAKTVYPYYNRAFSGEIVQYQVDLGDVYFETILSPVEIDGKVFEVAGSSYDITERVKYINEINRLNEKLKNISETDSLTNIHNRLWFDNVLEKEIDNLSLSDLLGVLFMDIDCFKSVNDKYGHKEGDFIIKKVARCLEENISAEDYLARWGGDEFVILVKGLDLKTLHQKAILIKEKINKNLRKVDRDITVSFGVYLINNEDTVDSVIRRVDKALMQAKKDGKNKVVSI